MTWQTTVGTGMAHAAGQTLQSPSGSSSLVFSRQAAPGVLLAWHQTCTGDWWALATFELTNRSTRPALW